MNNYAQLDKLQDLLIEQSNKIDETLELLEKLLISLEDNNV